MSTEASEPISGVDIAWLRMDTPTNLMIINSMLIIDKLDFDEFKTTVRNRFLAFSRFKKHPVCHAGQYFWELDPYFDIDNHVHKVALTGRADKAALQAYLADQLTVAFDPSKPLWQIHFVENYIDGVAAILRVHHCYADGISLVSVFNSITDSSPNIKPFTGGDVSVTSADTLGRESTNASDTAPLSDKEVFKQTASSQKETETGQEGQERSQESAGPDDIYPWPLYQQFIDNAVNWVEKYTRVGLKASEEGVHLLRDPDVVKAYANDCLKMVSEVGKLALLPPDPETSLKGPLGARKKCAWSEPVSLDYIKDVANGLGCKINDLLMSCVAGALREKMQESGDDVEGHTVHVTVPVNIRPATSASEHNTLGNYFGTVFVPLPVGIANPIERVYKLKHDMIALKKSFQPGVSFGLLFAAGLMPKQVQKPLMDIFAKKTSAVMSNVPGAKESRYFAGAKIKEQMFWVPQTGGVGLGLSIISYAGQVQFGLIGDAKLFPNPDRIVQRCVDHIESHRFDFSIRSENADSKQYQKQT
ncbi:WS/DGAT domain-containing protein [Alkalimarinus alittae]|uniref:diacylglycerol O-acyltransferase n=1 Tax=Alkalimarinus alittae TaxID=2961619 RepID=A0ABY6N453_9ALTE|nr:WS/DGAT domain-containing protein [Alkalimarinus alittae]UZE96772.1 WS/DGAT domain-containing protein [Alkalimarinus alittae]